MIGIAIVPLRRRTGNPVTTQSTLIIDYCRGVRGRTGALLAGIVACSAGLLLFQLGAENIGLDESFSVLTANSPATRFWELVIADQARMSAYYVILRAWIQFGDSEAWVRGLSVVLATATLPVVFVLGARLFTPRAGLFAAMLLGGSPLFIRYGQEARAYSLLVLLVCLSTLLLVEALSRRSGKLWFAYGCVAALALFAHYFAAFVVLGHAIVIGQSRGRWSVWHVLGAASIITVAAAALAGIFVFTERGALSWIPPPSPALLVDGLETLVGRVGPSGLTPLALAMYGFVTFAAVSLAIREFRRGGRPWQLGLIIAWLIVPVAVSFGLSTVRPMFVARYLIVSLPALVLVAAAVFDGLRPRALGVTAAITLLAMGAPSLAHWYEDVQKPQWREIAAVLSERATAGDAVAVFPWFYVQPLVYHVDQDASVQRADIVYPLQTWTEDPTPGADDTTVAAVLSQAAASYDRIWFITEESQYPAAWIGAWEALADNYREVWTTNFSGIEIALFDSSPPAILPITWLPGASQRYSVHIQEPISVDTDPSGFRVEVEITSLQSANGTRDSYEFPVSDAGLVAGRQVAVAFEAPKEDGWYVVRHRVTSPSGITHDLQSTRVEVTTRSGAWTNRAHAAVRASPRTHWEPGETQTYIVSVRNVGTTMWASAGPHPVHLGIHFGGQSDLPSDGWETDLRVALPRDVAPNEVINLEVSVRAPQELGDYVLRHRMVLEGITWYTEWSELNVRVGNPALP